MERNYFAHIAAKQNAAQRKGARVGTLANVGGSVAPMRTRIEYPMHSRLFTSEQQAIAARVLA